MDDSRAEFDKHDMELLAQAQRETDAEEAAAAAQAATQVADPAAAPAPAPAPAEAPAQAPAEAPAVAPAASPAPAPAEAKGKDDGGSPRAALRAARHAERTLREENAALRKQLEASSAAAANQAPKEPDETQLNDVREYAPTVGEHIDQLKAENERLRALVPKPSKEEPGFVPDVLPEDVQEAVDDMPELLDWQTNPLHQDKWELVKSADTLLMKSETWKGRSYSERFSRAMELVKTEIAATPSKAPVLSPADAAKARIAAAAAAPAAPVTLGDLRGGQTPASVSPRDPYEMVKQGKSDEEIIASLAST